MQEHTINGKTLKFKPHTFEGIKSIEYYENQIITTLSKIGITKEYIEIIYSNPEDTNPFAQVIWEINRQNFIFKCESQLTPTLNLGAIAQAIQEDIRQVTRGIKDLYTIMNQYKTIEKKVKKKNLFDFQTPTTNNQTNTNQPQEENFSIKEIQSASKEVINELPTEYIYLTQYPTEKLNAFYFKVRNECVRNNDLKNPLLKALKTIRFHRGIK